MMEKAAFATEHAHATFLAKTEDRSGKRRQSCILGRKSLKDVYIYATLQFSVQTSRSSKNMPDALQQKHTVGELTR